jgi:hypothetical protein
MCMHIGLLTLYNIYIPFMNTNNIIQSLVYCINPDSKSKIKLALTSSLVKSGGVNNFKPFNRHLFVQFTKASLTLHLLMIISQCEGIIYIYIYIYIGKKRALGVTNSVCVSSIL